MPTERQERHGTDRAMQQIFDYVSPGTNEPPSFQLSRVTDDLFTSSFLAGGALILSSRVGARGILASEDANAWVLDSGGGAPKQFPVAISIDLNTGKAKLTWTLPGGSAQNSTIGLDYIKTGTGAGSYLLFDADEVSDSAAYALSMVML